MISPWMTREQAAEYYGVSTRTLDRWLAEDRLKGATVRLGSGRQDWATRATRAVNARLSNRTGAM